MYPLWIFGALMVWATIKSGNKEVVRVEKPAVWNWIKFLGIITLCRIVMFKLSPHFFLDSAKNIIQIPILLTFSVFWEDATHGLPLLLFRKFIGTKWWTWPIHILLTAIVMLEFGLGHIYQGIFPAILLSFYIPYSIRLGKKYGFGTVMIGHTLYDFITIFTLKVLAYGF